MFSKKLNTELKIGFITFSFVIFLIITFYNITCIFSSKYWYKKLLTKIFFCAIMIVICGSGSVVERHLAKVNVASSNLVFRSTSSEQAILRLFRFFVLSFPFCTTASIYFALIFHFFGCYNFIRRYPITNNVRKK